MNIAVCIKQTFDSEAPVSVDSKGNIDDNGVNLVINTYDEYAIEEAVRIKEKFGGEITVITVGAKRAQEALRTALAMGADKAVLINDPLLAKADEWVIANVLAKVVASLSYDIVFTGQMSIDGGSGQVGTRLSEQLNIPSVTNIIKLTIDGTAALAKRETDEGTQELKVNLPALFTTQKGLNDPRYPTIMGIMKSKKKEVKEVCLQDMDIAKEDLVPRMTVEKYAGPEVRQAGRKLEGSPAQQVAELVNLLKTEVKAF